MARSSVRSRFYDKALDSASQRKPDLAVVFNLLRTASERGDARADYALATWYLHGKHVQRNLRLAMPLLRRAAAEGIGDALFDLAVSLETGEGIKKNARLAAECYLKSALAGASGAYYEVGRCYYYGIGFARDRKVARAWLDASNLLKVRANGSPSKSQKLRRQTLKRTGKQA